jgi:hypothetical protein
VLGESVDLGHCVPLAVHLGGDHRLMHARPISRLDLGQLQSVISSLIGSL